MGRRMKREELRDLEELGMVKWGAEGRGNDRSS